ncbi:hypothetical protein [Treponema pectinovorum]|uniref:hypothetical protein n=1 Tax=Treponema pectinovorum TaxID=164 RepID=UPI003D8F42A5
MFDIFYDEMYFFMTRIVYAVLLFCLDEILQAKFDDLFWTRCGFTRRFCRRSLMIGFGRDVFFENVVRVKLMISF